MKKILMLCASVLVAAAVYAAWRFTRPEHYGQAFTGAPLVSVAQLIQKDSPAASKDVRVEGTIIRQCPATGCWFYIDDGKGSQVRVELGKVVSGLPQRIGRRAIVEGRMVQMGDEAVFAGNGVEFHR
jgi:uncharacterized protein YdeI (BOF family)